MAETTITFSVDEALKIAFEEAAVAHHQDRQDLLRGFMHDYVDGLQKEPGYDDWFRKGVLEAIAAADAGDVVSHEDVEAEFASLREETLRKARLRG